MVYELECKDLTDAQKERLYLLIEEASEVQKQVCKILRFGYPDKHPETGKDNLTILHEELGDLMACIILLYSKRDIDYAEVTKQIPIKQDKFKKYTRFQGM